MHTLRQRFLGAVFVSMSASLIGCGESEPIAPAARLNRVALEGESTPLPQKETRENGRIVILRRSAAVAALRDTAAAWATRGNLDLQAYLDTASTWNGRTVAYAPQGGPSFETVSGGALSTESFPQATVGPSSTIPELNGTSGDVKTAVSYMGTNAHSDMIFGARDDDNTIDIPDQPAAFDDQAASVTTCATTITQGFSFDLSNCIPFGTLHGTALARVNYACGVHLYGSATHHSWFALPIPTIGGSVSGTGAAVGISFSWLHYHDSAPLADPRAEAYNGPCVPPDNYVAGSESGGESSCPDEDVYMWFHWNPEDGEYDYMGDVCIQNGVIAILDRQSRATVRGESSPQGSSSLVANTRDNTSNIVTIAYQPNLPRETPTLVVRRAREAPAQVILVGPSATREDLLLAIGTLGALQARDGDALAIDTLTTTRGHLNDSARKSSEATRVQGYLDQLKHAQPSLLAGVGNLSSIQVDLGAPGKMRK